MSVSIYLQDAEFNVKPQNVVKINQIFLEYSAKSFRCPVDEVENPDWHLSADINIDDYLANPTLKPTFELELNTEYSCFLEEDMFRDIAPFVEKGSWIQIEFENETCRVYFDGKNAHWVDPEIIWNVPKECK